MQLTKKQIELIQFELLGTKKHWSEKKKHCITIIKSFYKEITEDKLQWFLEVYVPSEDKRIKRQYFIDSQTGKINTKFTPTDIDGDFDIIQHPVLGVKYHLSWAFKGAVFVLRKMNGDFGWVDNPKHKRGELLKIKLKDLRKLH